jgi:hypothetical protein
MKINKEPLANICRLLTFESMEARRLMAFDSVYYRFNPQALFGGSNQNSSSKVAPSASVGTGETTLELLTKTLTARLTGTGNSTVQVLFQSRTENGAAHDEFKVIVRNATVSSSLDVTLDGVVVGKVTTNTLGHGSLKLATVPTEDEVQLPVTFPKLAAGSTIQVGTDIQGVLVVPTPSPRDHHHREHHHGHHEREGDSNETVLTSSLSGTGTQRARVRYENETVLGLAVQELKIIVDNLTPSVKLDVTVAGVKVGQVQTDAKGHGILRLSSSPHRSNETLLPADFPAIDDGQNGSTVHCSVTFDRLFDDQ